MMRTASSSAPLSAAGDSLMCAMWLSYARATRRGANARPALSRSTMSSALSTLAATARSCAWPLRSSRYNQPDSCTTSRTISATRSLPTRRTARPSTSRARVSSGNSPNSSMISPERNTWPVSVRESTMPACGSMCVARASSSVAPRQNMGEVSSGIRPFCPSSGLARKASSAVMAPTSGAWRNTEVPPATTHGIPAARTARAYTSASVRRFMRMTMSPGANPSRARNRAKRSAMARALCCARSCELPPATSTACRRAVAGSTSARAPLRVASPQESRCKKSRPSGLPSPPSKILSA